MSDFPEHEKLYKLRGRDAVDQVQVVNDFLDWLGDRGLDGGGAGRYVPVVLAYWPLVRDAHPERRPPADERTEQLRVLGLQRSDVIAAFFGIDSKKLEEEILAFFGIDLKKPEEEYLKKLEEEILRALYK